MTGFDTVLISVLTSAGVTLAIEWAAKPRLEARKERILDQSRARQEIIRQLRSMVAMGAFLSADTPSLSAPQRRLAQTAFDERRSEVITAVKTVNDLFPIVALKINRKIRPVISHAIGNLQGIAISEKLRSQAGKEIAAISSLALELYDSHWWNVRKCRKLLEIASPLVKTERASSD